MSSPKSTDFIEANGSPKSTNFIEAKGSPKSTNFIEANGSPKSTNFIEANGSEELHNLTQVKSTTQVKSNTEVGNNIQTSNNTQTNDYNFNINSENKKYYIQKLKQLENLQKNKNCTQVSVTNPVIVYPVVSLIITLFSLLITIIKVELLNIVILPLKLIASIIMILMFTIILVLICNFFSNTTTWIFTILFLLISLAGAPALIYFGGILLIAVYIFGITGTTLASIAYYFKDSINNIINGTPAEQIQKEMQDIVKGEREEGEEGEEEIEEITETEENDRIKDEESSNIKINNNTSGETSNITANTLDETIRIFISQ